MLDQKLNNNKIIIGSANFGLNYSHLNSYKSRQKKIKNIIKFVKRIKLII